MSNSNKNPGPVPPRWLHCPRKSENLIVGKFLAMKTPLDSKFNDQVPPECRFPPEMLFRSIKNKKIKIGLWIDLTNTNRYYNKKEIEEHGCNYIKLECRGHGETPSKEQTGAFIKIVHKHIIKYPLDSIAVHCTHGFNRTGFLIVAYMVEKLDYSVEAALGIFAAERPVGIYKRDYINELYKRYDDIEDAYSPPPLPNWCTESDDTNLDDYDDNTASTSFNSRETDSNKKANSNNHRTPKFMEGISGVHPFMEQPKLTQLRREVQQMCEWKSKSFPGSQPVSMSNSNIHLLSIKPYRVSWKADGMRYMMLIDGENEVYFFDRDNNVFHVENLRFVYNKNLERHLVKTLLDGEMVIDKVNGENIPRYLVYDIVMFDGKPVGKMSFYPDRFKCIDYEIISPRHRAMERGLINKSMEPFSVRKKDFWDITQAASLLGEKFARNLSHEPDGLIFQPSKEPYTPGRCDEVLKWKPLTMNSIDFKLKIVVEGGEGKIREKVGQLFVGQKDLPFSKIKYHKSLKDLNGKIIECKWEDNRWKFMRERTDKSFPNSFDTAIAVLETIQNPVTKEYLLDFIQERRFNDDSEKMPPPKMIRK